VWGHFYASPSDVTWGSLNNPDLFVKIWFDAGGRIDVNYFHVSVPDIEVYSDYPDNGSYDQKGTTIMSDRYIRHEYGSGGRSSSAGIWIGAFTSNVSHLTFEVIGAVTESGVARFAATSTNAQFSAELNVSGNNFSATPTVYSSSGSYIGMGNITGTFIPKGFMNGTYSGIGDSGTFSLVYNALYERSSSLSAVAGTWTNYSSGYYETITIDSNGNITRPPISGCTSSGSISVINSLYNIYHVSLSVDNCGSENGLYNGLAVLTDTKTNNDTLFASTSNSSYSFVVELRRQ
jgi:hypothetical protein